MTQSQWKWIFGIIIVLIILLIVWAYRDNIFKKAGATNTSIATLQSCNSLSYDEILSLQKSLNKKGCTDYEGESLEEDGVCGPRTNSALSKCQFK